MWYNLRRISSRLYQWFVTVWWNGNVLNRAVWHCVLQELLLPTPPHFFLYCCCYYSWSWGIHGMSLEVFGKIPIIWPAQLFSRSQIVVIESVTTKTQLNCMCCVSFSNSKADQTTLFLLFFLVKFVIRHLFVCKHMLAYTRQSLSHLVCSFRHYLVHYNCLAGAEISGNRPVLGPSRIWSGIQYIASR